MKSGIERLVCGNLNDSNQSSGAGHRRQKLTVKSKVGFGACRAPALQRLLSLAKGRYTEVNFRLFDRRSRVVDIGPPSATFRRSRPAASGRINIATAILDALAI